jgi:hypothetical protein
MQLRRIKGMQALLAAVVTALVVMPIAIAGASGGNASASATSASAKQLKVLKKQSANLAKQATALAAQVASIEAKVGALEGKPAPAIPTTLPPSGAAGGDLSGTFPNPRLAANTVSSTQIISGSVNSDDISNETIVAADIAAGAVGPEEVADGSIRGVELGNVIAVAGAGVPAAAGALVEATVTCPGNSRLLSGGFEWAAVGASTTIGLSSPSFVGDPRKTWQVTGRSASANTLVAEALCLS